MVVWRQRFRTSTPDEQHRRAVARTLHRVAGLPALLAGLRIQAMEFPEFVMHVDSAFRAEPSLVRNVVVRWTHDAKGNRAAVWSNDATAVRLSLHGTSAEIVVTGARSTKRPVRKRYPLTAESAAYLGESMLALLLLRDASP